MMMHCFFNHLEPFTSHHAMNLQQIEAFLDSPNPQARMKALTELRHFEADIVVPVLKQRLDDKQFVCRSFIAMGLGFKRNAEAYDALLDMLSREKDHNVISEIANSLSKYGEQSLPKLVEIFEQQSHWLIRRSILATMEDFDCLETVLRLCRLGICDEKDLTVKRAAISLLGRLQKTPYEKEALPLLLEAAEDNSGFIRAGVARQLRQYEDESAQAAVARLRQDSDHRVVGAVLEGLLPTGNQATNAADA